MFTTLSDATEGAISMTSEVFALMGLEVIARKIQLQRHDLIRDENNDFAQEKQEKNQSLGSVQEKADATKAVTEEQIQN